MDRYLVVRLGFIAITGLATLLIGFIVLRGPDTHHNLGEAGSRYDRTDVALLGGRAAGYVPDSRAPVTMLLDREVSWKGEQPLSPGKRIFIEEGCGACHGVDARGGPVGPSLANAHPEIVERMVREGQGGMPAYGKERLSDSDMGKLAAYLKELKTEDRPTAEQIATIQRMTFDPSAPRDTLLKGKAALRRSCGGCHTQPDKEQIREAFGTDAEAAGLVAQMAQNTNLSLEDARTIAQYMLALRNDADPMKVP